MSDAMIEVALKVGDVVRVRHNIAVLPDPYNVGFILVMGKAAGKTATVSHVSSSKIVSLRFGDDSLDGWNWATSWLEPIGASALELTISVDDLYDDLYGTTKEESTLSIQTDLINTNVSDNKEYLMRKGIIMADGRVSDSTTFLQWMLAENEDAFVKALKDAEAKRLTREEAVKATETPVQ